MVKCPTKDRHFKPESVKKEKGSIYICTCGCKFRWHNENDWDIINPDNLDTLILAQFKYRTT